MDRPDTTMTNSAAEARRSSGRAFLFFALATALLGIAGYAAQIAARHLPMPWYLPCSATLGAIFAVVSIWQTRTVWRALVLMLLLLLAGAEWSYVLVTRLPQYAGPLAVGKKFPGFETKRADGASFNERDLQDDQATVFVFFRGRW